MKKKMIIQMKRKLQRFHISSDLISKIHLLLSGNISISLSSSGSLTLLLLYGFLASCQEEDQDVNVQREQELDQLRAVVAPYHDLQKAVTDGYDNEFTGYRMQMGFHYLDDTLLDNKFEVEHPEFTIYAPNAQGNLQFVAVEYAIPIDDMDNPPLAPEGFSGDTDVWEINTEFKV